LPFAASPAPVSRESLTELAAALRELHKILMEEQRDDYERTHPPIGGGQLLHLVAYDDSFAWLRTLSALTVDLDALLDEPEPASVDEAGALRGELEEIFSPAAGTRFWDRCLPLLQTPRIAVAYARVRLALAALPQPTPADVAADLHAQHRWAVARRMRGGP
jgi:hypothetical protein